METPKEETILKCELCKRYPRLEGTNKCESCYSAVRHVLEQDPRFKDKLLPDLRKKQETLEESLPKNRWKHTGKQETLEEAAEKEFPLLNTKFNKGGVIEEENLQLLGHRRSFIKGAKWQAERMYSEEEVGKLLDRLLEYNMCSHEGDELIKQFKKK